MADIDLLYPQKLGRFNTGDCFDLYYSEPIAKGRFYEIREASASLTDYILLDLTTTDYDGWGDIVGSIFSSGIISGEVTAFAAGVVTVKVNKDSFVTLTDFNNFLSKHSGIYYDFEILRYWNGTGLSNAVETGIKVHYKKRINDNATYSNFGFTYNKDFYYEITTKSILLNNLSQIDDILRAGSYVLKSQDDSVIRTGLLDDLPDVTGIVGDTANIVQQPYFGGLQNNEWYRATLIDNEFIWDKGRYKGKLKFKITG